MIAKEVGHGLQSKAAGDEVVELHRLSVRARVTKNHGPDDVIVQVIAELGQGAAHLDLSQADSVGAIPVHFVEGVDPVVQLLDQMLKLLKVNLGRELLVDRSDHDATRFQVERLSKGDVVEVVVVDSSQTLAKLVSGHSTIVSLESAKVAAKTVTHCD